jgi:hypothetical protein
MSSVWYDRCEIDLGAVVDTSGIEGVVHDGIRERVATITTQAGPDLRHVSLRVTLTGSTPVAHCVREAAAEVVEDFSLAIGGASVAVETLAVETMPAIDLAEHAGTNSAPGALARLLLELDRGEVSDDTAGLVREVRRELERVEKHKDFTQLDERDIDDRTARMRLQTQARALLTQLVTQNP